VKGRPCLNPRLTEDCKQTEVGCHRPSQQVSIAPLVVDDLKSNWKNGWRRTGPTDKPWRSESARHSRRPGPITHRSSGRYSQAPRLEHRGRPEIGIHGLRAKILPQRDCRQHDGVGTNLPRIITDRLSPKYRYCDNHQGAENDGTDATFITLRNWAIEVGSQHLRQRDGVWANFRAARSSNASFRPKYRTSQFNWCLGNHVIGATPSLAAAQGMLPEWTWFLQFLVDSTTI
jgi:hypothetical protein